MRVLDLGAGTGEAAATLWPDARIVTVDIDTNTGPDYVADVRALPELDKFDHILAAHVLEHLPRLDIAPTLRHWADYLVDGGELHIVVPCLEWAAEELRRGKPVPSVHLMMHLHGSQTTEHEFHKTSFTALTLRAVLERTGYRVVRLRSNNYHIVYPPGAEPVAARQLYARCVRQDGSCRDGDAPVGNQSGFTAADFPSL